MCAVKSTSRPGASGGTGLDWATFATFTVCLKLALNVSIVLSSPGTMDDLTLPHAVGATIPSGNEECTMRKRKCCGDCAFIALYSRKRPDGTIRWIAICELYLQVVKATQPICSRFVEYRLKGKEGKPK